MEYLRRWNSNVVQEAKVMQLKYSCVMYIEVEDDGGSGISKGMKGKEVCDNIWKA